MSHDHGWRAACGISICILRLHLESLSIARGVTVVVVGSGALFGLFSLELIKNPLCLFAHFPISGRDAGMRRAIAKYALKVPPCQLRSHTWHQERPFAQGEHAGIKVRLELIDGGL